MKTVIVWMSAEFIHMNDIMFGEMLLLNCSAMDSGKILITKEIPEKKILLTVDVTFKDFQLNILSNHINLDIKELLLRYIQQGLCKIFCLKLLDQAND